VPLKKICRCGKLIDLSDGMCSECKAKQKDNKKGYDKKRGSSSQRGYDSRWQKYRIRYLRDNPLCVRCLDKGTITPATVVDHIKPHKGDKKLFWDSKNHQSLCKQCHDIKTASEDGGFGNE
jgi:5-methylcytosine-specific restriction protein A